MTLKLTQADKKRMTLEHSGHSRFLSLSQEIEDTTSDEVKMIVDTESPMNLAVLDESTWDTIWYISAHDAVNTEKTKDVLIRCICSDKAKMSYFIDQIWSLIETIKEKGYQHIVCIKTDDVLTKRMKNELNFKEHSGQYILDISPRLDCFEDDTNIESRWDNPSKQELDELCSIPGITIDTTNLPQELKDGITHVEWTLEDRSQYVSFPELESIGGWFCAIKAKKVSLPNLQSNDWNFYANLATEILLPKLEYNLGEFYALNLDDAAFPMLQSNGWDFYINLARLVFLPAFKYNGWDFYTRRAKGIFVPGLRINQWDFYSEDATVLYAPTLERVNNQELQEYSRELYGLIQRSIDAWLQGGSYNRKT